MVNGSEMFFSKEKMIKRLESEGKGKQVTPEILAIMDNLDGQPVSTNSSNRQVNDAPLYSCKGKDGKFYDVFEGDCI